MPHCQLRLWGLCWRQSFQSFQRYWRCCQHQHCCFHCCPRLQLLPQPTEADCGRRAWQTMTRVRRRIGSILVPISNQIPARTGRVSASSESTDCKVVVLVSDTDEDNEPDQRWLGRLKVGALPGRRPNNYPLKPLERICIVSQTRESTMITTTQKQNKSQKE